MMNIWWWRDCYLGQWWTLFKRLRSNWKQRIRNWYFCLWWKFSASFPIEVTNESNLAILYDKQPFLCQISWQYKSAHRPILGTIFTCDFIQMVQKVATINIYMIDCMIFNVIFVILKIITRITKIFFFIIKRNKDDRSVFWLFLLMKELANFTTNQVQQKKTFYNCSPLMSAPSWGVWAIWKGSFINCTKLQISLKSSILPKTCIVLGPSSFINCTSLEHFKYEGVYLFTMNCFITLR